MYGGTTQFLEGIARKMGIEVSYIDGTSIDAWVL